ncbi:MAG TPA: VOC family protein [Bryobacteraceae bacterium]|nr:VOC family protein [Bryobacteraceae bacterium]
MKIRTHFVLIALSVMAAPLYAQLPPPNAAGVSAGHDIFSFHDIDAANKFWNTLGGEAAQLGPLKMTKFPGVLFLMRKGDPKGGTEGSTIEYIGFKVKNLADSLTKWEAAGITPLPGKTATQAFLMGPDDVKVRITEDRTLNTPIAADQIKMLVPDVAAAEVWYEKWFGAKPIKRNGETVGEIPGANILFARAAGPVAGTKGRAFDRIGLEVKNVEQKCKDLEAAGIKLDTPYRKATSMNLAVCVLTDPWGTYIEISEGLAAVQ